MNIGQILAMLIGLFVVVGIGVATVAIVLNGIKKGQWPVK